MPGDLSEPGNRDELATSLDVPASTFATGTDVHTVPLIRASQAELFRDTVTVTYLGSTEIFEGDIDLSPEPSADPVTFGLSIRHGGGQWPGGVVHFLCEAAMEPVVLAAIAHWEQRTPIRFRAGIGQGDYVSFEDRGRSHSKIGRATGPQLVALEANCTVGAVIHEIGHVLGLWHEQSRTDRDQYVRINPANVRDGEMHNFNKHDGSAVNRGAYDLLSIMHYPSDAFSKNGSPTITTAAGGAIPPRHGLSDGDIAAMRELYSSLNW